MGSAWRGAGKTRAWALRGVGTCSHDVELLVHLFRMGYFF